MIDSNCFPSLFPSRLSSCLPCFCSNSCLVRELGVNPESTPFLTSDFPTTSKNQERKSQVSLSTCPTFTFQWTSPHQLPPPASPPGNPDAAAPLPPQWCRARQQERPRWLLRLKENRVRIPARTVHCPLPLPYLVFKCSPKSSPSLRSGFESH